MIKIVWGFWDKVLDGKVFEKRSFVVIVNGKPRSWFKGQGGSRQGDLSPFLFSLVVDVLSRLESRGVDNGLVKGLFVGGERVLVSHLQFADDIVFYLEPVVDSFVNIVSMLGFFKAISGLKINPKVV